MQIVTDSGCDLGLTENQAAERGISIVPLNVTLDGITYTEGPGLNSAAFYSMLEKSAGLPTTSQPSAGTFAELYRTLARKDRSILSIHISSGLSGTLQSAIAGAQDVPEAKITFVDTKTLSVGAGWLVSTAARAIQAGWPENQILSLLDRIRAATETMFTLKDLKFLIHGGRISHMKGLIASVLNIKPIIGVEKQNGSYAQMGQAHAFSGAIQSLAGLMESKYHANSGPFRAQVVHAENPSGAAELKEAINQRLRCSWLPTGVLSLVLGAHTGPTMIGAVLAPVAVFEGLI
jgi:DegV family protein with EDD domain